jgi:hypothetical protein
MPVRVRVVWDGGGEQWIDGTARRWTPDAVFVAFADERGSTPVRGSGRKMPSVGKPAVACVPCGSRGAPLRVDGRRASGACESVVPLAQPSARTRFIMGMLGCRW